MIELNDVSKTYQTDRIETLALQSVNLSVQKGELISVMGPSGCGKSTLDAPSKGHVALDGERVNGQGDRYTSRLRNEKLGFIFQSFHLVSDLRVVDNVEIPLLYRKISSRERKRMASAALERVGLSSRARHFPSQLSGGQQQRVAIARAIVGNPRILLADEPTGNLDSQMGDEVMEILHTLNTDGTTIVMVTHDGRLAETTDRIIRLFDGRQVS